MVRVLPRPLTPGPCGIMRTRTGGGGLSSAILMQLTLETGGQSPRFFPVPRAAREPALALRAGFDRRALRT